jgi:tetratricopeptide (TPR) repeat protein
MRNWLNVESSIALGWEAAQRGENARVLLIGEAGIGKTWIADRLAHRYAGEALILNVRGSPTERSALAPVYDAVYAAIRGLQVAEQTILAILERICQFVPFLQGVGSAGISSTVSDTRLAVLKRSGLTLPAVSAPALFDFLGREVARGKPIVLCADDAHWLDEASWDVIRWACDEPAATGRLVLITYDPHLGAGTDTSGERALQLAQWKAGESTDGWRFLNAERWTPDSVPLLCDVILKYPINLSAEDTTTLCDASGGLTLCIESILHALRETKAISLDHGIFQLQRKLSSIAIHSDLTSAILTQIADTYRGITDSRKALELASVIGTTFDDEAVDSIAKLATSHRIFAEVERRHALVQTLLDARDSPDSWKFRHPQIQRLIYEHAGGRVSRLHLRLAEYLAQLPQSEPFEVFLHYRRGGDFEAATEQLRRAIDRYIVSGLYKPALQAVIEWLHEISGNARVVSLKARAELELLRGQSLYHLEDYPEAINTFERITLMAPEAYLKYEGHRWLGRAYARMHTRDCFERAVSELTTATKGFADLARSEAEGDAYVDLITALGHLNRFDEARCAYEKAEAIFARLHDSLSLARLQRRGVVFMAPELLVPILLRTARTFEELGLSVELVMSLNNAATELIFQCRFSDARNCLERAIAASEQVNSFGRAYLRNNEGVIALMEGRWKIAAACFAAALESTSRSINRLIIGMNVAIVRRYSDGPAPALEHLVRILEDAKESGEQTYIVPAAVNAAAAAAALGRSGEVRLFLAEHQAGISAAPIAVRTAAEYLLANVNEDISQVLKDRARVDPIDASSEQAAIRNVACFPFVPLDMQFWSD